MENGSVPANLRDLGARSDDGPANNLCDCGRRVDTEYLKYMLPDAAQKCRFCKTLMLLTTGIKVEKYCYGQAVVKRKTKLLWLSEDYQDLYYKRKNSKISSAVAVPLSEALGVVYGAYTSTFKRQKDSDMPPHWAAFSIVSRYRTYDFSAHHSQAVEAAVMGLQQVIWERRQDKHESGSSIKMSPLKPWSLGFFLWMRLRFRLQEHALKAKTDPNHMLWIVFMRCAFACPEENSKRRFIGMAKRLEKDLKLMQGSWEVGDIDPAHMRTLCQKNRAENIIKGVWYCMIDQYIPHSATVRDLKAPRKGNTKQLPRELATISL